MDVDQFEFDIKTFARELPLERRLLEIRLKVIEHNIEIAESAYLCDACNCSTLEEAFERLGINAYIAYMEQVIAEIEKN